MRLQLLAAGQSAWPHGESDQDKAWHVTCCVLHGYRSSNVVVERDLFAIVKMLKADGLDADVWIGEGVIEVSLEDHMTAFDIPKYDRAADWLVACALLHFPDSSFSKLVFARCAGGPMPQKEDRS